MVAPASCARPDPLNAAHSRTYLRNRRLCFPGNRNSGPEIPGAGSGIDCWGRDSQTSTSHAAPQNAGFSGSLWFAGNAWWRCRTMYQPTLQALRNSSFYLCRESSQSTSRIILGSPEFSLDFCDGRIVSATGTSANLLIFLVPLAGLHSPKPKQLKLFDSY